MIQHATLTLERWREFGASQQVLMIANEMHRASRLLGPEDGDSRRNAYERVLRLTDLTIQAQDRRGLRRELLRWRDLVAEMYIAAEPRPASHLAALQALLLLDREAARQRPYVLPRAAAAANRPEIYERMPAALEGITSAELLDHDRGER